MRRINQQVFLSALITAAAAFAGCNPIDAPIDPITGVHEIYPEAREEQASLGSGISSQSHGLVQVGSCDDVVGLLRQASITEAIRNAQAAYASAVHQHEHCSDVPWGRYSDGGAMMPSADAGAAYSPAPGENNGEAPEHSETNNQVAGVDEADLVKTDGNHIYLLGGGALRIVKAWPAAATQELARVTVEGEPKKLFVLGDRLLVYSSLNSGGNSGYYPGHWRGSGECTYGYECVPTGDGFPTKITVLDIADRSAPRVVRELQISSSLLAARRIGRAVHTVVTMGRSSMQLPHLESYPQGLDVCEASARRIYDAFRALLLRNLAALQQLPVTAVLPVLRDRVHVAGQVQENASPFADCRGFYRTSILDGQQLTSVLSLAIDDEQPARAATIVSPPGVVYASQDSLYLGLRQVPGDGWGWYAGYDGVAEVTTIHKFRLDNAGAGARYAASGLIKGRLLNQFAMDEHRGFLRLASTSGHLPGPTTNAITVLEQRGDQLQTAGLVDKLAPTEDIRSVRFDGDKGYVVTFKKTDPLFVIDLATPARPRVLGELKIPGFSTYMQKMDETHLLTIGYDGDDQGSFAWFTGVALQIFDVSNPTDPRLKFKHVIGTRGSSSEALTNHLAFTYYAPKNLLALPITICEGGSGGGFGDNMTFSGLMVLNATTSAGFSLKGQVAFTPSEQASCSNWWTNASSQVKRSLIIGDFVYSMSDALLKVNALDDLGTDLATLSIDS